MWGRIRADLGDATHMTCNDGPFGVKGGRWRVHFTEKVTTADCPHDHLTHTNTQGDGIVHT